MNKLPYLHYPKDKNSLIKTFYIALIPLIIFSIYKNGILLYQNNLIKLPGIFIPIYFYIISIIIGIIVSLIFKEDKKINILKSLLLSLCISINTNYYIYPLVLLVLLIISKYIMLKTNKSYNDLAIIRLLLILSLLINSYSYLNILEKIGEFNYNFLDIFLGFSIGGIGSSSLFLLIISFIILASNKFYQKEISFFSMIFFFLILLISFLLSNNEEYLKVLLSGHVYYSFIFIAPSLNTPLTTKNAKIIYGSLIGILSALIMLITPNLEVSYFVIFLISLTPPFLNKFTNRKYLQN